MGPPTLLLQVPPNSIGGTDRSLAVAPYTYWHTWYVLRMLIHSYASYGDTAIHKYYRRWKKRKWHDRLTWSQLMGGYLSRQEDRGHSDSTRTMHSFPASAFFGVPVVARPKHQNSKQEMAMATPGIRSHRQRRTALH